MKETVVAAIMGAVNAYLQQEEQTRGAMPAKAMLYPETSAWRVFGRQELMRARTNWHVKRANR
jgi:hypothetical protein